MTVKREMRHTLRFPKDITEWLESEKERRGLNKNSLVILAIRKYADLDPKGRALQDKNVS